MQKPHNRAFTTKWNGIARVLSSDISVSEVFFPGTTNEPEPLKKSYHGIWDTGATASVITARVAAELGLRPIGMTRVSTAGGMRDQNEYLVNFYLPNKVAITQVRVTEAQLANDLDILVGMDIICLGDFVVTNKDGKTIFSFRFPSCEAIDFVSTHSIGPMSIDGRGLMPTNRAERRRFKKQGRL